MKRALIAGLVAFTALTGVATTASAHDRHHDRYDRYDRYDRDHDRYERDHDRWERRREREHRREHRRWARGERLPYEYRRGYEVYDYHRYGYAPPPPGYRYYRTDRGDVVLVAIATGVITAVILDALR